MSLSFFKSWFGAPAKQLPHLHFILHTRRGCHLCEDAWQILSQAKGRYGFTLEAIDVDDDLELAAAYGETVPVVTVNGKVRFRGGVNAVLLERLLRGEQRKV